MENKIVHQRYTKLNIPCYTSLPYDQLDIYIIIQNYAHKGLCVCVCNGEKKMHISKLYKTQHHMLYINAL